MTIELNNRPSQPVEFKPYLIGDNTRAELAARELLLAPDDVDYTVASVKHADTLPSQVPEAENIVVPQLVDDKAPLEIKKFENKLPDAHQIPQLAPDTSDPRYRL